MILKVLLQSKFIRYVYTQNFTQPRSMNIKNFVFFDIETTGLPYQEYNKTRITEMCFVIVESEHISLGVYPRVQNKLVLCFNPRKAINPSASQISGLSNELLEHQPAFDENSCQIIRKFLELQRRPLCFVAHNGNCFDYPILNAELHKAGGELFEDILCVDSLPMFKQLDWTSTIATKESIQPSQSELDIHDLPTQRSVPIELCDGFDELLCDAVDSLETTILTSRTKAQELNEQTPAKPEPISSDKIKFLSQDHLYFKLPSWRAYEAVDDVKSQPTERPKKSQVRRKLFGNPSFKLIDVYKRLTDKENENAHQADQDVQMLIECAARLGQDFVDWANANARKLSNIPMMRPGVKIGA